MDGLQDVSKVCRLCLQASSEVMCPIFPFGRQSNGTASLAYRIMACARVKLTEGDGLPPNICTSCLAQVDRSYQFKLLCEKTDLTLRGEVKADYASSTDTESLDGAESCWDMTKFTPEVIIKEDADEGILMENGPESPGEHQLNSYYTQQQSHHALYPLHQVEELLRNHGTEIKVQSEPDDSGAQAAATTALLMAHRLVPVLKNHRPRSSVIGADTAAVLLAATNVSLQSSPQSPKVAAVVVAQQQNGGDDSRISQTGRRQSDENIQAALNSKSRRCRGGDKLFKCSQCNKSYSFSSALSRHKAVHNKELRPHICKVCNKGFTHPEKLLRHQKTHSLDVFMTCDVCSRPFKSYPAYQKHKQIGNCESGNCTNFCHFCNIEYDSYKTHVCHTRTNTEESPAKQPNLKRTEYVSYNEQKNEQQLLGCSPEEDVKKTPPSSPPSSPSPNSRRTRAKSDFKCKVCEKYFATKGSLEVHSTIHTGVRPFVCSACSKSFRHKVNLMEHFQRKHSQVRPYICDVCAARFVTKQELVRHYRKHIGD